MKKVPSNLREVKSNRDAGVTSGAFLGEAWRMLTSVWH